MSLDLSAAVEAAHRATCFVPDCAATYEAETAVAAAAPIIESAIRKEQAGRIATLEAIVAEIGKYGEDMLTVADPNVRLIGTALIKAASVARGTR